MLRKVEIASNVAVILAALIFSITIVREHWFARVDPPISGAARQKSDLEGKKLELGGVKWDAAERTLVMALSTACHFCEASVPFYREVTASSAVKEKRVAVVAVFPQQQQEAESFVKGNDIRADRVVSTSLQSVGASATPTLLLVDRNGKIQRVWVGVLSQSQQNDLLSALANVG